MKAFVNDVKKVLPKTVSGAFAMFSFAVILYYIFALSPIHFHSDCTDSLLWALASYESGEVFNPDFGYAALLPFGASVWFVPLIAAFGVTMKTQLAGMAVFLVLFTLSLIFMCRSFKWSLTRSGITVAAMLMILSSSDKLREIMWGHVIYYSLGLMFLFLILGLIARLSDYCASSDKGARTKAIVMCALLFILTAGTATDGFQVIGITCLPAAGAVVLAALFDGDTKLLEEKNRKAWLTVFVMGVATVFGFLLLTVLKGNVYSGYTSAYSCYSDMKDIVDNALLIPKHLITLLGANWENGSSLVDLLSVMNLARIGFAVLLTVCPVILFFNYKKLSYNSKLILWSHTVVTALLVYLMVFGRLAAANWRLTPFVGTGILVVLETGVLFFKEKAVTKRLAVLGTVFIIVFSMLNMYSIMSIQDKSTWQNKRSYYGFTQFLKENDITNGYATFWNSNRLTLLSDSEVVLRTVSLKSEGIKPDLYQSDSKWFTEIPDGERVCLVLTKAECNDLKSLPCWKSELSDKLTDSFTYKVNFVKQVNNLPALEQETYYVLVFEGDILVRD